MQIRKDGAVVYNSIDNTGSTDDASLGARYAMGRLDTLDARFSDYFDKNEIYDLLEQKSAAEFVDELPGTLVDNTWYYSKKFADGTSVPNDKRALYAKDADGVTQYLGIIGDIDLSAYYTAAQSDARYEPMIDAKAPLAVAYNGSNTTPLAANDCVFDIIDSGITGSSKRIAQHQVFSAYLPAGTDTIQTGATHFGTMDVTEYYSEPDDRLVFIKQRFTKLSRANAGGNIVFERKGFLAMSTGEEPYDQVVARKAEVTWRAWRIIEYPLAEIYNVNGAMMYSSVRGGMCYLDLSGNFNPRVTSGEQNVIAYVKQTQLRPAQEVHGTIQNDYGHTTGEIGTFWIGTNGHVMAFTMTDWTNIRGSVVYPIGY